MINEVILVGKIKDIKEEKEHKNTIVLDVERPFSDVGGRVSDTFNCQLWSAIFSKVICSCKIGDIIAIKGRIDTSDNNYKIAAENVVLLNKSKDNIQKKL